MEQPLRWIHRDALVWEFFAIVRSVEKEDNAIDLRTARLLLWAKAHDVSEARYPSWTAFVKEHSPWQGSHTRALMRLAASELQVIKDATSNEEIDLTVAMRARKELGAEASREAQLAWLARIRQAQASPAAAGEAPVALPPELRAVPNPQRGAMCVVSGDEMHRVLEARRRAAPLIGWSAPASSVDDFIVDCHVRQLTGELILDRARAKPPTPPRLGRKAPEWHSDPSVSLLGPWEEPTDIHDAVAKLRAVERLREQRRGVLGMAYFLVRDRALWTSVPGCRSLKALCLEYLGISQRTFQRYAREGRHLVQSPELKKEVEEGRLTLDRAVVVADHAGSSDEALRQWIDLVKRLGRAELQHAQQADADRARDRYAPCLDMAREVESIAREAQGPTTAASGDDSPFRGATPHDPIEGARALIAATNASRIGGAAGRIASHLLAAQAQGPLQVARRGDTDRRHARQPDHLFVRPDLLPAADYLLSVVAEPRETGARKVVVHDGYICQNPRCRRRTLRVHHHHLLAREHGGTDDPWNIVTLCPACHLRGVHSRKLVVKRIDDWLIWTWPPGGRTGPRRRLAAGTALMYSPVGELPARRTRRVRRPEAGTEVHMA